MSNETQGVETQPEAVLEAGYPEPHGHDDPFARVPGGLYTVVFGVLALITIIEVALAEAGLPEAVGIPLLSALSIGKAVLVVMYYMHLREDSRIFIWAFGVPLAMAALIILFLLAMDPVNYG